MPYPETPLRLAVKTGRHPEAIIMWPGECTTTRGNASTLHSARVPYAEGYTGDDIPDGHRDVHPEACAKCGSPFDPDGEHTHSAHLSIEWNTDSGKLEPGCVYLRPHVGRDTPDEEWCSGGWTNCDGQHLIVVLPNGAEWDVDGRATNCGSPDDTTHRCWVRQGDPAHPETLHVAKDSLTCAAGAGSIQSGDYHGFLIHGVLVP